MLRPTSYENKRKISTYLCGNIDPRGMGETGIHIYHRSEPVIA